MRTGHSARMCSSIVCAVSLANVAASGRGRSKRAVTNALRSKPEAPRERAYSATIAAGGRSGLASANVFESGKIPESCTAGKSGPRSCAGS